MTDKNTSKLLELIKPEVDFDISNTPTKPDYSNLENFGFPYFFTCGGHLSSFWTSNL